MLDDAWAKLNRAKAHIDQLASALPKTSEQGVYPVPIRREYKANLGAVVVVAESVPELPDNANLIVGDALHNFRSALDVAWWQLVIKHLGAVPPDDQATSVQFPIRRTDKNSPASSQLKWVGQQAIDIAESIQPNKRWDPDVPAEPPFIPPPFGALRHLSNLDKHRVINVTFQQFNRMTIRNPMNDEYRDCVLDTNKGPGGSGSMKLFPDGQRLKSGSEILRIFVRPTGPNPDVDIDPNMTVVVVIEPNWHLFPLSAAIGSGIADLLRRFEPLLK